MARSRLEFLFRQYAAMASSIQDHSVTTSVTAQSCFDALGTAAESGRSITAGEPVDRIAGRPSGDICGHGRTAANARMFDSFIGCNMAGVHYFSDYYDSLRMGEDVAISILEEQALTYPRGRGERSCGEVSGPHAPFRRGGWRGWQAFPGGRVLASGAVVGWVGFAACLSRGVAVCGTAGILETYKETLRTAGTVAKCALATLSLKRGIDTPATARNGDTLGYARVSTHEQNPAAQNDRLTEAGAIRVFTDTVTGKHFNRPGLAELIDHARPGDRLCVTRLDRLARLISERTRDGIAAARKRGRKPGRPPLDPETVSAAQKLIEAGMTPGQAAKQLNIGRATAYRIAKATS